MYQDVNVDRVANSGFAKFNEQYEQEQKVKQQQQAEYTAQVEAAKKQKIAVRRELVMSPIWTGYPKHVFNPHLTPAHASALAVAAYREFYATVEWTPELSEQFFAQVAQNYKDAKWTDPATFKSLYDFIKSELASVDPPAPKAEIQTPVAQVAEQPTAPRNPWTGINRAKEKRWEQLQQAKVATAQMAEKRRAQIAATEARQAEDAELRSNIEKELDNQVLPHFQEISDASGGMGIPDSAINLITGTMLRRGWALTRENTRKAFYQYYAPKGEVPAGVFTPQECAAWGGEIEDERLTSGEYLRKHNLGNPIQRQER